ncbi:MAG: hypothetical protein QF441_13945 [Bacteriovoracaceae bacterium]|jgi:hypothetical protein|nr:hypothetical protein [Halobacteriovoraceae bacterium]MDP7321709.1 hypothetical protein [Bacteriovoracaceae bacterium]|tara:strand:+ start:48 stop:581 length:534 start_codon:yes stop_codon:yes gene_type:complete
MRGFLIFLFFMTSCGLKVTEEVHENVLQGEWTLDKIVCSSSFNSDDVIENYEFDNSTQVKLTIKGLNISYSASGVCSTSSTGILVTNFNGSSTGVLDLVNIITGGVTCSESLLDNSDDSVGSVSIPTTLDGSQSKDLNWLVTNAEDVMELSHFSGFKGSSEATSCNSNCHCRGIFLK